MKKWTRKNEPKSAHSDVAKSGFREIRTYIKSQFGDAAWNDVNEELKTTISDIALNPAAGKELEKLRELGQENFRMRLVRQTRIVYEYDDKVVLVHILFTPGETSELT